MMDGFQATMALRQKEARLSRRAGKPVHTPVIAITATANYKQKCIDAGMDDWMPKPFDKDKLCRLLNRWLGKSDDTPGESDRQAHQGESKMMTVPEEERRRAKGEDEDEDEDEEKAQERQDQGQRRRRQRRGGAGCFHRQKLAEKS